ncbi:MAG: efflux RND transporter periplasmic adaptor subunit [Myxococcaceae bacterium]|nr:efflux RND transporter periplasmic adaptor subunit [Myxococcaceae bacterium]MCA3013721.1 efflux RND transporter periplasmic adaptor subunit [Myxococcaceae bacterium]
MRARRRAHVGMVAGLALLAGCRHAEATHEEPVKVPVTSALRRAVDLPSEYVGQLRAVQHIEVRALEHGYLQGIFVDEGQRLEKGQKMFQLMPTLAQAEVQKAEAETERSQIELNNTRVLADKNVVSPNELALAKANLARAQAQLNLAAAHRGLTEIRAPFAGIMGRFHARQGSLIDEGDLLTTLSDNSTMWVYFNVAESQYLDLVRGPGNGKGRPVKLVMANGETYEHPGTIQTIDADFDNETGTIAFRAAFPNPTGLLRHGETGKVLLTTRVEDAVVVAQQATFDVLDKKFVYVVDEKNVVHSRPIVIHAELPQLYVVSSGLTGTERIVLDGLRKVHDGAVIEPQFHAPDQALSHLEVPAE